MDLVNLGEYCLTCCCHLGFARILTSSSFFTLSSHRYSYVNKGHNVYNKNDNDVSLVFRGFFSMCCLTFSDFYPLPSLSNLLQLVDLKNLTLDIDILSDDGKSTKSSHKGKWDDKCSGSHGCCVKSVKDGGHNVVNKNDQDVSSLTRFAFFLALLTSTDLSSFFLSSQVVDLKGASVGLHVLSGVTKSLGAALGTQTNGILGTGLHL